MSTSKYTNTAYTTDYGVKASNGTMGILVSGTKVLIIHRRLKTQDIKENGPPDTWSFPGGGLEEDETPEQCIIREMKEELGVDVAIKPIGDEPAWGTTDDDINGKLWRCTFFVVQLVDDEQKLKVSASLHGVTSTLPLSYFPESDTPGRDINEPTKHVKFEWIEWNDLWDMIKADMEGNGELWDMTKADMEGNGELEELGEMKSFFSTMKNMVLKYPQRCNWLSLYKRIV
uniref:Nudix hydrolase domain-containing protein n=1 Tax=Gibberella zeae TaxID=5518 RepID=A0A4E9EIV3_GIBZA